jgi:hypothetical protein
MNLTPRDRKILIAVVPIVLLVGYWFLLLSPQRKEASKAANELSKQEQRRGKAQADLRALEAARSSFASDYATLVKLGKAVPTSVHMPSLIVQLESAARGTNIEFTKIAAGDSGEGGAAQPQQSQGSAQSAPGKAAQNAQGAAQNANQATTDRGQAAQQSGVDSKDAQTSQSTKQGGLPVGGGQAAGGTGGATAGCAAGLECVPLEFEFKGDFFDLAAFFHRLKRFVAMADDKLVVRGRLMTIDALKFASDDNSFPALKAEVKATVYLSPKAEGTTGGATAGGPSKTVPAGTRGQPSTPTPTATATP